MDDDPWGATDLLLTLRSFLATWIILSSRLRLSRTRDEVSSSSSSRLTLERESPISELVINPMVLDTETDWLIEFICSDRYSTV